MERTFRVEGMTCEHCTAAVQTEVAGLPGVQEVDVDLATKLVRVRGDAVEPGAVAGAIAEAGYEAVEA